MKTHEIILVPVTENYFNVTLNGEKIEGLRIFKDSPEYFSLYLSDGNNAIHEMSLIPEHLILGVVRSMIIFRELCRKNDLESFDGTLNRVIKDRS